MRNLCDFSIRAISHNGLLSWNKATTILSEMRRHARTHTYTHNELSHSSTLHPKTSRDKINYASKDYNYQRYESIRVFVIYSNLYL